MDDNNAPIFILSCERSGSTLLRYIMDTHLDICCPSELHLGRLCNSLYITMDSSIGQIDYAADGGNQRKNLACEVRAVVEDIMARYSANREKKIWCEKSPQNVNYLHILSEVFPQAKYVCLYRNSMDVVYSCIKFNPLGFMLDTAPYVKVMPENTVAALLNYWCDYTAEILQFEEKNREKCFRLSYESLVNNPAQTVQNMFDFLGYTTEVDDLLDKVFIDPHDYGEGDLKVRFSSHIHSTSIGKGINIPLTSIPSEMIPRIDSLNTKIGYTSIASYYRTIFNSEVSSDHGGQTKNPVDLRESEINSILTEVCDRKSKNGQKIQGRCRLIIQGLSEGSWIIESLHGLNYMARQGNEEADCTIALSLNVFSDLVKQIKNVSDVYENGEIGASGDLNLAIKFGRMLFT